jgi:cobaltochelatase CobT
MTEAATVQQQTRQQQKVEELCAGTLRALSGDADLRFRGRRLHRGASALPLFAPHLHPSPERDDFASFRGAADGMAMRLLHSDEALHRSLCPTDPVQRLVFELLEQFRAEACAPDTLPGLKTNLRHRFEAWSLEFYRSGLAESASGILLYTVAQVCRARVTGDPVTEATEDLMEATRASLAPVLGTPLHGLRRQRHDQAAYALPALEIAALVARMLREAGQEDDEQTRPQDLSDPERAAFSLLMDFDATLDEDMAAAVSGRSRVFEDQQGRYQVFTRAYDKTLPAGTLVRPEVLREYREMLDRRVAGQGVNVARLARELKAILAEPAQDGWDSGQEQGRIDGRRLAQLVSSPTERRLFRTEHHEPLADCVLSFLIDCSGSMRQHIETVAMIVDIFSRALEQAGVSNEVLGYTTGAWNGGKAQRDWLRAGKPRHPGRLNEACHLIFKDADTSWRRARPSMGALLKADLFREGIDGEAVSWACQRLKQRPEPRRLLLVISDGCPMDGATNLANDTYYLDNHLKDVVATETQGGIAILGVGVGLDLSPFYPRSLALDLSSPPGYGLFRELLDLLARCTLRR